MRFLGTAVALGCGFPGGVFTPALVFGALLGGVIWVLLSQVSFAPLSNHAFYSIVGMGALASAMLGAPISTVLIVFELTANYDVTIAVMVATALSSTLMQLSPHTSYFRWQLARRDVNITSGRDQSLLLTRSVEHLVKDDCSFIAAEDKIIDVERLLSKERNRVAILIEGNNLLLGSASLAVLVEASIEHGFEAPVAGVLIDESVSISVHTNLVAALQKMAEADMDYMPVTEASDEQCLVFKGLIFRDDLLRSYYEVMRAAREHEFGVN
jgi:CIC family chloride channel protein